MYKSTSLFQKIRTLFFPKKMISVVIPIHNSLDSVKKLITSLKNNFDFNLGEIIIVNDCSDTKTTNYLHKLSDTFPKHILISNKTNVGFIKSCNAGMKTAQGQIIVLLNSDTEIPKSFCKKIIKCFASNKKIGIASPISSNSLTHFIPLPKHMNIEQMNTLLNASHTAKYPTIPSAEGFCYCIRRDVINTQGYLDEVYGFGYHEEVDYSYRAITNGWRNVLIDDLYVFHERHASFGTQRRSELIEQNNPVFSARWRGFMEHYVYTNKLIPPVPGIINKMLRHLNHQN